MDGRRHASATLAAWLKMRLSNFYQRLRRLFATIAQPARHNRAAKLNSACGRLGVVAGVELIVTPEAPLAARNHSPSAASKNG